MQHPFATTDTFSSGKTSTTYYHRFPTAKLKTGGICKLTMQAGSSCRTDAVLHSRCVTRRNCSRSKLVARCQTALGCPRCACARAGFQNEPVSWTSAEGVRSVVGESQLLLKTRSGGEEPLAAARQEQVGSLACLCCRHPAGQAEARQLELASSKATASR
jgi:hypothetical protein